MLTVFMITLALTSLGLEPVEGTDPKAQLDAALAGYGLEASTFLTERACFTIGYSRGLAGASYTDEHIPAGTDGKPLSELEAVVEQGFAIALEARDVKLIPPAGLVYQGWKDGVIKPGQFEEWASKLDLKDTHRLAVAITVGSGKTSRTIPAGTPVEILSEIEKDGVASVIVMYDGLPLIVPNPADSPRVVSGATAVSATVEKKVRAKKAAATNADGTPVVKTPTERGPTLQTAIRYVIETSPGALQTNGQFASRVLAKAKELGIGDKASTFVKEADRHVPYYLNTYRPAKNDANVVTGPGRMGILDPKLSALAAIEGRKFWSKGEGLTADARYAQIPEEIRQRIENSGDERLAVPAPVAAVKAAS